MTKYCPRCHLTLPRTAFGRHARRWDGCQSWCRACMSYAQRKRYALRHGYGWVERAQRARVWPPAARAG
jgi:hypothetical protein